MSDQAAGLRPSSAPPLPRLRGFAVTGGKGGVGQTCVAVNLAVLLAATSRPLLIDLDLGLANATIETFCSAVTDLAHPDGPLVARNMDFFPPRPLGQATVLQLVHGAGPPAQRRGLLQHRLEGEDEGRHDGEREQEGDEGTVQEAHAISGSGAAARSARRHGRWSTR